MAVEFVRTVVVTWNGDAAKYSIVGVERIDEFDGHTREAHWLASAGQDSEDTVLVTLSGLQVPEAHASTA